MPHHHLRCPAVSVVIFAFTSACLVQRGSASSSPTSPTPPAPTEPDPIASPGAADYDSAAWSGTNYTRTPHPEAHSDLPAISPATEDKEPLPCLQEVHVVLIAVPLLITLLLIVGTMCAVRKAGLQPRIGLPSVIMLAMWTALIAVGVITWSVTSGASKEAIGSSQTSLLTEASRRAIQSVHREMDIGIRMLLFTKQLAEAGNADFEAEWPAPQLLLNSLLQTVGLSSSSVHLLYYATPRGRLHGIRPGVDNPSTDYHYICLRPDDAFPPWVVCPVEDYPNALHGVDTLAPTCGEVEALNLCEVDANETRLCRRTCLEVLGTTPHPSRESCYGTESSLRLMVTPVRRDSEGGFAPPSPELEGDQFRLLPYRPQERPWYTDDAERIQWSEPYLFASGTGTGITASIRVQGVAGESLGVVAVDFSLWSLNHVMRLLRPTPNSISAVVTLDHYLVGSSLVESDLSADSGIPWVREALLKVTEFNNSDSLIQRMVLAVEGRHGTLRRALAFESMFLQDDNIVLSFPIDIYGMHLVMALSLPYSDIMGKPDEASVMALVLALSISIVCALVVFGVVHTILHPLNLLAAEMCDVACMRLYATSVNPGGRSRFKEIADMQESFGTMVKNLIEYRQYLPQSVLCGNALPGSDLEVEDDDDDDAVDGGTGRRNQHPALGIGAAAGGAAGGAEQQRAHNPLTQSLSREIGIGDGGSTTDSQLSVNSSSTAGSRRGDMTLFSAGLRSKIITLVVVNIKQFHMMQRHMSAALLTSLHTRYLDPIVQTVRGFRGIVDEFSGDHIFLSFNTAIMTNLHTLKAVECAVTLSTSYRDITFPELATIPACVSEVPSENLQVSMALASGKALCGNLGCTGVKKYSIIGHVATSVRTYERWGCAWGIRILTDATVAEDGRVATGVDTRKIAQLMSPKGHPCMLHEVVGCRTSRTSAGQEWMYQLDALESGGRFVTYNACVDAIYKGDFALAGGALQKLRSQGQGAAHIEAACIGNLQKWLEACEAAGGPPDPIPYRHTPSQFPVASGGMTL